MRKTNVPFFAAALLSSLLVAGCTGTETVIDAPSSAGSTQSTPEVTQSQAEAAAIQAAVKGMLSSSAAKELAAVGGYRNDGFANTPLLDGAPAVVRLIVACSGGGTTQIQTDPDTVAIPEPHKASISCDSIPHVIEDLPSKSLEVIVPPAPGNTGYLYVSVAS